MDPIALSLATGALATGVQLAMDWYRAKTGLVMPEEERQRLIAEGRDSFASSLDRLKADLDAGRPEEAVATAAKAERKAKSDV